MAFHLVVKIFLTICSIVCINQLLLKVFLTINHNVTQMLVLSYQIPVLVFLMYATIYHPGTQPGEVVGTWDNSVWLWLGTKWMFIHLGLGALLFLIVYNTWGDFHKLETWFILATCMYMSTHQFEEHGYDMFGRRYPFVDHLADIMGCNYEGLDWESGYLKIKGNCFADTEFITLLNCSILEPLIVSWCFKKGDRAVAQLVIVWVYAFNAVLFHILPALLHLDYNPGLLQSVVINAPLNLYIVYLNSHYLNLRAMLITAAVGGFMAPLMYALPAKMANLGFIDKPLMGMWVRGFDLLGPLAVYLVGPTQLKKIPKYRRNKSYKEVS